MVTGAMSKAGGSVGGFKLFPEISQRVDGRDSGPSIRFDASRFCRCEQTKWTCWRASAARNKRPRKRRLEGDVVVEVAAGAWPAPATTGRAAMRLAFVRRLAIAARIAAAGIEHGEFAAETLQHDFGRVFLLAGLVGPLPRLQLPLDIDLRSLVQVLLRNLDEPLVEDHDAVPLRL